MLLNVLIAALTGVVCWRIWAGYQERVARETRFFAARPKPMPEPALLLPPPPQQVSASQYFEVAAQLPFSPDRNPTVIVETAPPKPMPPLPLYFGMMNLGGGPRVILSHSGKQKSYVVGETIGEFKLAAVTEQGLTFEWDGKQVPVSYTELRAKSSQAQPAANEAPAPATNSMPASTSTRVSSVSTVAAVSESQGKPAATGGAQTRDCAFGDTSPEGTVADGYRKVLRTTPFGKSCYWEKVN